MLLAVAVVAAGCTDDGTTTPTTTPATSTTTTVPEEHVDDGVLRIGVLLPESGSGAAIGQPMIDAVLAAGDVISAAGGVLGPELDIVTGFDEGDSPATASDAIATLVEQEVDAVVGPASSTIALATLSDLLGAGVLTCSPTATALALDDFPDRRLFIRTAPSDSLQAAAIASEAERTGALSAAVVFLDDAYGRPLADATVQALQAKGIEASSVGFAAADDTLLDEAATVQGSDARVIIVIGDAEHGPRMLADLGEVTGVVPRDDPPTIIVNDAMRRPAAPQQIAALAPAVRSRILGLSPAATNGLAGEPAGAFATNALDCINLIALASAQADSDDPETIAAAISAISAGGVSCRDYASCVDLVAEGRNVDYDGPGGRVEIGADGDPVSYPYERWRFDEQGVDRPVDEPGLPAS